MCAAVLGQCGPRVPSLKSLFHSQRYNADHVNETGGCFSRGDRHAHLQSLWQEIGDDKPQKQEELREMIAASVDKVYERALDECIRRKMALEEMVTTSEHRLKECLGSIALQVIAPKELPLQVRLSMNTSRLKDIENARLGGYGWFGGLVVLAELRRRVAALREMLKLPPCGSFADLDEILASTTNALNDLASANISSLQSFHPSKSEKESMLKQMQRFYQTLCAMESACRDSGKNLDYHNYYENSTRLTLHELELKVVRNSTLDLNNYVDERSCSPLVTSSPLFGFTSSTRKRYSPKFRYKAKEITKQNRQSAEEAVRLEQLSHKTLKKLEDISKHITGASKPLVNTGFSPISTYSCTPDVHGSPESGITELSDVSKVGFSSPSSMSTSEDNSQSTPKSVLPEHTSNSSSYQMVKGNKPASHWAVEDNKESCLLTLHDNDESIDVCWAELYEKDIAKTKDPEVSDASGRAESENEDIVKSIDVVQRASKFENVKNVIEDSTICSVSSSKLRTSSVMSMKQSTFPSGSIPPPPPPPPPPFGARRLLNNKTTKLKKSVTISRLYMDMKKKADGADNDHSSLTDMAIQRKTSGGSNNRDGMAEALAEITRRSSYFRNIEDDVHKHAASIMEVKSGLESFETRDMEKLIQFHESIEMVLEQLTDESQVLAKFEGFPVKKLETVRAAASLYLRMSSIAQQIEDWSVESPISENLDKITNFFEKVKTDVETIERTKDDDISRFQAQKIHFSFDMIIHIKEAMVGLSSRSLALALRDSQRSKSTVRIGDEDVSLKDLNKLRGIFQMMWKVFQLAFRIHNFAGGHDEKAEHLCSSLAKEMETYPSSFWLELVNK